MNEEKYKLLQLIDTYAYIGYTLNIFDDTDKEQQIRELLNDNLIYILEDSGQAPKHFLTSHGKERLEDYQKSVCLQETIDEIRTSLYQEKQDRIKADTSAKHFNIATIFIVSITLATTVISGLFSVL